MAERPSTGEILDVVLAPRHPLAAATPSHTRLSPETLASGRSVEQLGDAWRAFVRDTDIVCSWGHYATRLFDGMGLPLPERLDLRHAARVYAKGKVGTLEDFVTKLGATPSTPAGPGRAHVRLAELSAIVRALQIPLSS